MTHATMRMMLAGGVLGASLMLGAVPAIAMGSFVEGEETDNCSNEDGAFDEAAFVIATGPKPGERVESGFDVTGCSRTFESNVQWKLLARDGAVLASGHTTGGGADGPGAFSFSIPYTVTVQQLGHLEVFEEDVSDGEGFPPGRTVIPLVLKP
ncbi:Gmad2 immunoglobulin-like domain-containing protein [Methyloceanibacter sp. wino2]|uniref:Gmad2 immunoglobulin-like domain-containing protein n=1 Tax=Methyloceanibacter sp. wino2 TaxID=2170729 RepID=UPI000D3E15D9|nr:Gmad2 immunoglobulin-like domain-containing protein [Methyloceanibacter sp. wino2]